MTQITSIKIDFLKNCDALAKVTLTLNDSFLIKYISIKEKNGNLFVQYPGFRNSQGQYRYMFKCASPELRDELDGRIIDEYQKLKNKYNQKIAAVLDARETQYPVRIEC